MQLIGGHYNFVGTSVPRKVSTVLIFFVLLEGYVENEIIVQTMYVHHILVNLRTKRCTCIILYARDFI